MSDTNTSRRNSRFFYGYIVVIFGFCVMAVLGSGIYSFGVFLKPVAEEFGWSRALTSGAYSLSMVLTGLISMGAGRMTDIYGSRLVVTVGGIFFGAAYLLMSHISAGWQLYLFWGLMVGVGLSTGFVPLASTTARWFTRRRGLMVGIVVSGVSVGTMFGPLVSSYLILDRGWRTSYFVFGILSLVLMVLFAQFLRRDPGQTGQVPYGGEPVQKGSIIGDRGLNFRGALRTRRLWMLFTTYILIGLSQMAVMVHIVPHATDLGVSTIAAANIMTIVGGIGIPSRVIFGGVADKYGNKGTLISGLVMLAVALFLLQPAKDLWALYIFAAIFGIGYACEVAMMSPLVAELFGLRAHGAILGSVNFSYFIGSAIGPLLAGYMFDRAGNYHSAFLLCAILLVVGIVLILPLRHLRSDSGQAATTRY